MVQLQTNLEELKAAKINLVAISYDSVEILKNFAERPSRRDAGIKITFPLLSDEGSKTIDAFGIRNKEYTDPEHEWFGIPHPGTYLVNDEGVVTGKIFYERYQQRHAADDLLELAKKVDG